MKKKSLQAIEDFYKNKGYSGSRLRLILVKDKEWSRLVKERREKLGKKISATKHEKKKYVLSTKQDYEILGMCKELEKRKLTKQGKSVVKLIKSQLEHDWRKPLKRELNKLVKKYKR